MADKANQEKIRLESPANLQLWVERGTVRVYVLALEPDTVFSLDVDHEEEGGGDG